MCEENDLRQDIQENDPHEGEIGGFLVPPELMDEAQKQIIHQLFFDLSHRPMDEQTLILPKQEQTPTQWHPDQDCDGSHPSHYSESSIAWSFYLRQIWKDTHIDPPLVDTSSS